MCVRAGASYRYGMMTDRTATRTRSISQHLVHLFFETVKSIEMRCALGCGWRVRVESLSPGNFDGFKIAYTLRTPPGFFLIFFVNARQIESPPRILEELSDSLVETTLPSVPKGSPRSPTLVDDGLLLVAAYVPRTQCDEERGGRAAGEDAARGEDPLQGVPKRTTTINVSRDHNHS